jgi:hypothetical protein
MTPNDDDYWWETVDVRPVQPGWRVVHIVEGNSGPTTSIGPMAGWLIQERQRFIEGETDGKPRQPNAERRVIAGEPTPDGYADPVNQESTFWLVLAPDEPEPSPKDLERELARRARVAVTGRAKRDKG